MDVATALAKRSTLRLRLSEIALLREAEASAYQTYTDAIRHHPLTPQISHLLGLHEVEEEKALRSPELNFDDANRLFEEQIEPLIAIRDVTTALLMVEYTRMRGDVRRAEMSFLMKAAEVLTLPADEAAALTQVHTLATQPELRAIMVDRMVRFL